MTIGRQITEELQQPLPGDRHFVVSLRGKFVLRSHPEHIARVMSERARLRVEEDIRNFRRTLNRRRNDSLLLVEVFDPFEGFHDPNDFLQGDFA